MIGSRLSERVEGVVFLLFLSRTRDVVASKWTLKKKKKTHYSRVEQAHHVKD